MNLGGDKAIEIIHKELSYKIVGILFDVYNALGYGYQEKYYQKAVAEGLRKINVQFQEQVRFDLKYSDKIIGRYFLDFLIDGKVILEIKKGNYFSKSNIEQVKGYLKAFNLKLGILVNFTSRDVKYKRILNIN